MTAAKEEPEDMGLEWIQTRTEMYKIQPETFAQKGVRKFKENPFIPIGCLATVSALGYGLYNFRTGNTKMSQYMMRTRIVAQGLTIAALMVGIAMGVGNTSRPSPDTTPVSK